MNEYGHQTNYVTPTAQEPVDTVNIPDDETEEETQHGAPDAKPATPLETSETQPQLAGPSSTVVPPPYPLIYTTTNNPPTHRTTRRNNILKRCQQLEVNLKRTLRTQLHRALTDPKKVIILSLRSISKINLSNN